ncbi:DUF3047 domain-containing protein [Pelotalea chapellei]|uniref:DUF3047 domain-containing protein n=1 Tax=Pelotalea chapellei TaxID=44671 RepID=A0ABS5U7L0_9BACT|nr:DUF3047 domain-containing protein [Pelotalea chapellei]MBT1071658.1 DUF3047 domain-containing protein [Pelotalea chapellei]
MKLTLWSMLLILSSLSTVLAATEQEMHLGRFSNGDMTGWKEQTLGLMKPKTTYSISKINEHSVLLATSKKSASGQIYKLNIDPKEYPILSWSWKIDHTIKKGDERTKEGDDFAARVYVLFPRGFFTKTRAICYVWANKLPKGTHVTSPFTANVITVAVDSGDELAGRWTSHQRNVYEDYKSFFKEEPPKLGAVAIMTDTDNTSESAIGYYGDISLLHSGKVDEPDNGKKEQRLKDTKQKEQIKEERGNKGFSRYSTSGPSR